MVLALALLCCLQDDPAELLERLRSGDPDVRDAAEAALVERGEAALPRLAALERDPDAEVSGRARRAAEEIRRRARVRAVRPDPVRLTLRADDAPIEDVLRKILGTFELVPYEAFLDDDRLAARRVTIDLKEATLWQTLDALPAAAGVELDFGFRGVRATKARRSPEKVPTADVGEARLHLHVSPPAPEGGPEREAEIRVIAKLPPRSLPSWWDVEGVEITDGEGRPLAVIPNRFHAMRRHPWLRTHAGVPYSGQPWQAAVSSASLRKASSIRFRGTLVLKYPRDVVRHAFKVAGAEGPVSGLVHGVRCTFTVERDSDGLHFHLGHSFEAVEEGPERRYVLWAEDGEGRWFGDLLGATLGGRVGGRSGGSGGSHGDGRSRLATLVLAELVGEDRVVLPFEFREVVPPPPR